MVLHSSQDAFMRSLFPVTTLAQKSFRQCCYLIWRQAHHLLTMFLVTPSPIKKHKHLFIHMHAYMLPVASAMENEPMSAGRQTLWEKKITYRTYPLFQRPI